MTARVAFLGGRIAAVARAALRRRRPARHPFVLGDDSARRVRGDGLRHPVLSSRVAGLPDVVHDWSTGFLVKPGDVGQMAIAMRFLTADRPAPRADGRRRHNGGCGSAFSGRTWRGSTSRSTSPSCPSAAAALAVVEEQAPALAAIA